MEARSLRSSPDPRATEEKATAVSSTSAKNDGRELIHRWRPAPEGTSVVSNNSLCLRNTLKCYHMELTGHRGDWKALHVVLLPQKLKDPIIGKDNKKPACLGIPDLQFISYQIG